MNNGNTAFYTYDAQKQRTAKVTGAGTIYYISLNGQPLAEHTQTAVDRLHLLQRAEDRQAQLP